MLVRSLHRRLGAPFWGALLLHLLLLLALSRLQAPARVQADRASAPAVSFDLVEQPSAAPTRAPAAQAPVHRRAARAVVGEQPALPGLAPPASATLTPEGTGASARARLLPPGGLQLTLPPTSLFVGKGRDAQPLPGPERVASAAERREEERARVAARLQEWTDEEKGREEVAVTRDHAWQELQDTLATHHHPTWETVANWEGHSVMAREFQEMAKTWARQAEAFGRSGRIAEDPSARLVPRPLDGKDPESSRDRRALFAIPQESSLRLSASLQIRQHGDGTIAEVTLLRSSGNRLYDAQVLAGVQLSLSGKLPKPSRGRPWISRWAFETQFSQVPPLPFVACAFDAYLVPRECSYPLKKAIHSSIRLESVRAAHD